jgi:hypothetical protein
MVFLLAALDVEQIRIDVQRSIGLWFVGGHLASGHGRQIIRIIEDELTFKESAPPAPIVIGRIWNVWIRRFIGPDDAVGETIPEITDTFCAGEDDGRSIPDLQLGSATPFI